MKAFLKESYDMLKGIAASPFTEFGYDALEGTAALIRFVVILIMSVAVLALLPVSIPLLVYLNRRSARLSAQRRAEFSARMTEALAAKGVILE